ncbi:MAG: hypothetical protein CL912_31015 [Deltaproteobacteria bacterium]|nr:hypothetical protein [Deltaproteobacteria bacterium]
MAMICVLGKELNTDCECQQLSLYPWSFHHIVISKQRGRKARHTYTRISAKEQVKLGIDKRELASICYSEEGFMVLCLTGQNGLK